jgi:hypothetical protein
MEERYRYSFAYQIHNRGGKAVAFTYVAIVLKIINTFGYYYMY